MISPESRLVVYRIFLSRNESRRHVGAVVRVSPIVSSSKMSVMRNTYTHRGVSPRCGRFTRLSHLRHVSISRLSSVRALHENIGQAAVAYLQPRSSATPRSSGHDPRSLSRALSIKTRFKKKSAMSGETKFIAIAKFFLSCGRERSPSPLI